MTLIRFAFLDLLKDYFLDKNAFEKKILRRGGKKTLRETILFAFLHKQWL